MPKVWEGTHVFMWQMEACSGGDITKMIAKAKELGIDGVLIKFANGSLRGDAGSQRYMDAFKKYAPAFKKAGFIVGGWIYQYLNDVEGEASACDQAIQAGADYICLNGEVDTKGKGQQVLKLGRMLNATHPNVPVGFSSFAVPEYHAYVPWHEYVSISDFLMPQIYWGDIGWGVKKTFDTSFTQWKKFGKPIAPTGQAYNSVTAPEMESFVALCKTNGVTGVSWWDWQHCKDEHFKGIRDNRLRRPVTPPIAPEKPKEVVRVSKDVQAGRWSEKAIEFAIKAGLMSNDADGNFNPTQPVTREMLAAVLQKLQSK